MRDRHMEFDIWLEDQIKKSDRPNRITLLEGDYDINWDKNLTQLVMEFRRKYPNDYNYYFATYFVPLDQNLKFTVDEEDDDFPDFPNFKFKEDFFI